MVRLCIHPRVFWRLPRTQGGGSVALCGRSGCRHVGGGIIVNPVEIRKTRLQTGLTMMPTHPGWWRIGMAATYVHTRCRRVRWGLACV